MDEQRIAIDATRALADHVNIPSPLRVSPHLIHCYDSYSQTTVRIFSDEPEHRRSHRRAAFPDYELSEFAADAAGIESTREFARNDARRRPAVRRRGCEN